MTITVTTCGECHFRLYIRDIGLNTCAHPENHEPFMDVDEHEFTIHPSCPESGPFEIITKPKNNDNDKSE